MEEISVLICIQARTNSTRFPQKIYQSLGKKMVLQHVVDEALSSKLYIERLKHVPPIKCQVLVLHPENDIQLTTTFKNCGAMLVCGSEKDVLSRFIKAQQLFKADYVVRLTSDCPLVLDFMISKHISVAVYNNYDYVSNVDEEVRTVFDGMDVEIMSNNALKYLAENVTSDLDKEHVTTLLRKNMPKSLKLGFIYSKLDSSDMKLSLDTPEDLEQIRAYFHKKEHKNSLAFKKYGKKGVHAV